MTGSGLGHGEKVAPGETQWRAGGRFESRNWNNLFLALSSKAFVMTPLSPNTKVQNTSVNSSSIRGAGGRKKGAERGSSLGQTS